MNEDIFLSALHESPNDELSWLALADWLEENSQPQRAELVRLMRQLRTMPTVKRPKARAVLEDRLIALLADGVAPVVPQVTNSIGMRFSLIEAGNFRVGSPKKESGHDTDEPLREMTLKRSFYMSVYPVTQAKWRVVMESNPSYFSRTGEGAGYVSHFSDEELEHFPVENVSWQETQQFVKKLSALPAEKQRNRKYRLAGHNEWECACRAGTTTPFHFGPRLSPTMANFGSLREHTVMVGGGVPNAFGLYDMHGNVWEWVKGQWDDVHRSIRGGAWNSQARSCRSAFRDGFTEDGGSIVGVRVVMNVATK